MKKCCDNCRHATDYWPMYCGNNPAKWGTMKCDMEPPRRAVRHKPWEVCTKWKEQESSHD